MTQTSLQLAVLVIIVGSVIVISLLAKSGFERLRLPPLIAYLLIGLIMQMMHTKWAFLPEQSELVFDFLAKLGIIALLFTIGLKSSLPQLLKQLHSASFIWIGNVLISGAGGFLVAWWLDLGMVTCIIIGVAMTATSVGVPSAVWERTGAVQTDNGQLFVDVAELDDISGIVLLAILFAVLPDLKAFFNPSTEPHAQTTSSSAGIWLTLLSTSGLVIGKLVLYGGACILFARYVEKPLVGFLEKSETGTDAVISITSLGIIVAGLAGVSGFSVAIGAFFAGLAFSRSRQFIASRTTFITMNDLFVPFFFISIGLNVGLDNLDEAWWPGLCLFTVAVAGKIIGTIGPGLAVIGTTSALALGIAMVPRAEITMIIMHRGLQAGNWAVTPAVFSAMVIVVLGTCLLCPPLLHRLIEFKQSKQEKAA